MSTTLYVRLPHRPHDQPQPWRFGALPFALVRAPLAERSRRADAGSQLLRTGHAAIADLPPADRLVLIVAAGDVLLTAANVPPLAPARLQLALPNLVEDLLASDAQPCHIAVGPALDAGRVRANAGEPRRRLLMITERAWLRAVLDAFDGHAHRSRHVLPAQLCLPLPTAPIAPLVDGVAPDAAAPVSIAALALEPAASSLADAAPMLDADAIAALPPATAHWQLTVRTGLLAGYGLLLGDDALSAWQALAPDGVWYVDPAADPASSSNKPLPPPLGAPGAKVLDWPVWIAGAQGCLEDKACNLAQFEFGQSRSDRWNLRAWRLPLALAAALLIVQLVGMNVRWMLLRQEQQHLLDAQVQVLRGAYPQLPVMADMAPLQLRRQVEQQRLASGRSTPDDFLPMADRFAQAARQLAPDALRSLEYRGQTLFVTLKAGTDTRALRNAAQQTGLKMEEDRTPPDAYGSGGPRTPPESGATRWTVKVSL